jgi:hypothetical protein
MRSHQGNALRHRASTIRENVEHRDKPAEILAHLSRGSLVEKFYQALAESAQRSIQWKPQSDNILASGRDW